MRASIRFDRADLLLLELLQQDARRTNSELARAAGLSESAISQRVRRIERAGIIDTYRAILTSDKLPPRVVVWAQVTIESAIPTRLKAFERLLNSIPEVVACELVTGNFDYLVKFVTRDMPTYLKIVDETVLEFKGVTSWASNVVLRSAKDRPLLARAYFDDEAATEHAPPAS